jgi:RHS repeat-associated protein
MKSIITIFAASLVCAINVTAQSCSSDEVEAERIVFRSEDLPVQLSGFFPYQMSGSGPAEKYAVETWMGNGDAIYPGCGCFVAYNDIVWSGAWAFSTTDFTDSSTKEVGYNTSVCVTGPGGQTGIKAGLGANSVASPPVTSILSPTSREFFAAGPPSYSSCTFGLFWDATSVTETLSAPFTIQQALARAETHKTVTEGTTGLQYWNNNSPATADAANQLIAAGQLTRTSPVLCPARRVSFKAQFCTPCMKGRQLITYYYKKWAVGSAEPAEFETFTEEVEFKEEPHLVPASGYRAYHIELVQGQQCRLVKVSARSLEKCENSQPGEASAFNNSVDMNFSLGSLPGGLNAGALAIRASTVTASLYTPAALHLLAPASSEITVVKSGTVLRQIATSQTVVDIVPLSADSYALGYYLPAQAGLPDPVTGLRGFTGDAFVTYVVDNPDSGSATNRVRFTETRGTASKVTLFAYDATGGSMTMTTGNGLRSETLVKSQSGAIHTETRTIKNALGESTSVVRHIKTDYPFGLRPTQEILDPAGAALTTTTSYFDNAATDGAAYGQVKLVTGPRGRWTRYTYDSEGRLATTVTPFLNTAPTSAENLNRVTAISHDTIADQDGDALPEKRVTTTESLLGVETGRRYEVTFSARPTIAGSSVETRWMITCVTPNAAWDAADNLVSRQRTFVDGALNGRSVSEVYADGTGILYAYDLTASTLTITMDRGALNTGGSMVVSGTREVRVETLFGRMISRDLIDIDTERVMSSEVVTEADEFGRPTRIDFADGTYELKSYACCGLAMQRERSGVVTYYERDELGRVTGTTRGGITTNETLDPDGRVVSVHRTGTDNSIIPQGSMAYDLAGRLSWSKDAMDRQTTYVETVNGSGNLVKTTIRPDGGTIVETYAKDGSLLSVAGTASEYRLGYEYGLDGDGVFVKEIRVGSAGELTEWVKSCVDFAGRNYKRLYADGAAELSYYNTAGQLFKRVDPDGVVMLSGYNDRGEPNVTAIDVNGNDLIDYAGADRVSRTTSSVELQEGKVVQLTSVEQWESAGSDTPTAVSTTVASMDGTRVWRTARGLTATTAVVYDGIGGKTVTDTDVAGVRTIQTYAAERLTSVKRETAAGARLSLVDYAYDAHGRLATTTDVRNGVTSYTYFNDDHVHTVTSADPDATQSGDGQDPQLTTHAYDNAGRVSTVTQPDGGVVNFTYWPTGKLKRTWGARTYPCEYTHDSQGRLKTLTTWKNFAGNSGQSVTTWLYSPARGFLVQKLDATNAGPTYVYKPSGRLLTRTWMRGTTTTYGYNAAGDLATLDYSDATPDVTFSYDRQGRTETVVDAAGLRTIGYDSYGAPESAVYSAGLLDALAVQTVRDSMGRLSTTTVLSGALPVHVIGYDYDTGSRMKTVTHGLDTATYDYEPDSALVSRVTHKRAGTTRLESVKAHDKLNRLQGVDHTFDAGAGGQEFSYVYNAANQRTRVTREDGRYWDYGYDSLGQVTAAVKKLPGGEGVTGLAANYTYDDIGNRVTSTSNGSSASYTTNTVNQYTQRTVPGVVDVYGEAVSDAVVMVNGQEAPRQGMSFSQTLSYPNGNQSWWAEVEVAGVRLNAGPGGTDAVALETRHAWLPRSPEIYQYDTDGNLTTDGRWSYSWDAENRLVAMETRTEVLPPAGPLPVAQRRRLEYAYDAHGRRIHKRVLHWGNGSWSEASSTRFIYDGWNLLAEFEAAGGAQPIRTHVWGLDLSGTMSGAGGVGGLLYTVCKQTTDTVAAACFDGNGNVSGYVDMATGRQVARYEYDAFGDPVASDGVLRNLLPFRFSTKFVDDETGLLYYGYRYYSPSTGRWLSRDPIEEQGGLNLYGMIGNDALNYYDLLGLKCCTPDQLAACWKLYQDIISATTQIIKEFAKYDAESDARGGHRRSGGHSTINPGTGKTSSGRQYPNYTKPYGHGKEIVSWQNRVRNLIKAYKDCLECDDKPKPPQIPSTVWNYLRKPVATGPGLNAFEQALVNTPDSAFDTAQTAAYGTIGVGFIGLTGGLGYPIVSGLLATGGTGALLYAQ